MRGPTTGARLRSTTTRRVPPRPWSSVHSTARLAATTKHEPALGLDLLDDALALLAVVPGDAHVAALLGLELDLVGQPALELARAR